MKEKIPYGLLGLNILLFCYFFNHFSIGLYLCIGFVLLVELPLVFFIPKRKTRNIAWVLYILFLMGFANATRMIIHMVNSW